MMGDGGGNVRFFWMSIGFVVHGMRCSAGMDEGPLFKGKCPGAPLAA